jgi:hypothetical protein
MDLNEKSHRWAESGPMPWCLQAGSLLHLAGRLDSPNPTT